MLRIYIIYGFQNGSNSYFAYWHGPQYNRESHFAFGFQFSFGSYIASRFLNNAYLYTSYGLQLIFGSYNFTGFHMVSESHIFTGFHMVSESHISTGFQIQKTRILHLDFNY